MIEHELLFLGLLKEGPKHGYEIKRLIEEELFPFVGLKIKSIYYPLKTMEKLGLVLDHGLDIRGGIVLISGQEGNAGQAPQRQPGQLFSWRRCLRKKFQSGQYPAPDHQKICRPRSYPHCPGYP